MTQLGNCTCGHTKRQHAGRCSVFDPIKGFCACREYSPELGPLKSLKVAVSIRCPQCDHVFQEEIVEGWQPPAWAEWFSDRIEEVSNKFMINHKCEENK